MRKHGSDIRGRFVPQYDDATKSLAAQAITTATTYSGSKVDLGSAYNGGCPQLGMWFIPSSDLAGGTSLTFILKGDADGSAGGEVTEVTSLTVALANYEPICIPIPQNMGLRYVQGDVTSVGVHSAGTVTSFVGPLS